MTAFSSDTDPATGEQLLHSPARLAALHRTGLLDTLPDPGLDRLSRLASIVLKVPIVLVSLVDAQRQFFKSAVGLPEPWASRREAPLSHFCCHMTGAPLVSNDVRADPRVRDSVAVHEFDFTAYAGMPLLTAEGHQLGHFCVIDHHPRRWSEQEQQLLQELAASVMSEIERCQAIAERQQLAIRLRDSEQRFTALEQAQSQSRQVQQCYFQAIEAVGDAFALYDANDCLVICNARYQQLFGLPSLRLQPGLSFHKLLQTRLHYGEIKEAKGCEAAWLEQRLERFRNPQGPFEQQLADNRWIQLREQRLQTGELLVTGSDITELKRTEQALQQSETQFRSALEYSAIGMALVAPDGRWLKVNPALCRFFAYSEDELLATDFQTVTHPDDLEIDLHFVQQMLRGDIDTYQMEKRYRQKTGQYRWGLLSVSLVRHTGGDPHYFISQIQDIHTRKQTEQSLAESEKRYRTLYMRTPAMLQSIDNDGRFINVSNHWLNIMGYPRDEVIGHKVSDFLTEKSIHYARHQILPGFLRTGHCQDVPYQFFKRDGAIIEVLASAIAERDAEGRIVRSLAVLVDVTERKRLEAELIRLARIDALTGAWNRGYFVTLLKTEIKRARRHKKALSILLCDIDHFKRINDAYGHPAGDSALCHFVAAAQKILRQSDHLGRWGGEEFVVVLPETPLAGAKQAAERLRQHSASLSVVQGEHRFAFTLSIGIAVLRATDTVDTIIARADQALYSAKNSGRNQVITLG